MSCGEPSGDLYAGALVRELRRLRPDIAVWGFGGDELRRAGCDLAGHYRGFSVTGLSEALRVVPRSWRMYRRLAARAAREAPSVFVAVDFPDFNFRLARAMTRLGVPVVYYVSPQLWAWRPGRMRTMRVIADRVLVIFPFEEQLYRQAGVPVEFVGHPLLDLVPRAGSAAEARAGLGLDPDRPVLALLPGSRSNEIRQMLHRLVAAVAIVRGRIPALQAVVARAPNLPDRLFAGLSERVVDGRTDEVLRAADVVVTASGTATVQTALHGVPMVVVYRLAPLTYRLGRPLVRVNMYAMVNLVAGRPIVRELIQDEFTPENVSAEVISLLTDGARAERMREELRQVRERLGAPGASARAARAVVRVLDARR